MQGCQNTRKYITFWERFGKASVFENEPIKWYSIVQAHSDIDSALQRFCLRGWSVQSPYNPFTSCTIHNSLVFNYTPNPWPFTLPLCIRFSRFSHSPQRNYQTIKCSCTVFMCSICGLLHVLLWSGLKKTTSIILHHDFEGNYFLLIQ